MVVVHGLCTISAIKVTAVYESNLPDKVTLMVKVSAEIGPPRMLPYITELSCNATTPATHQNILSLMAVKHGTVMITFGDTVRVPEILNTH